jgi:hypothetical protein
LGGSEEGSGFSGAMGYFRPSATFSFTNGTTLFFGFVAAFIFYFWIVPKTFNRFVLLVATIGLLVAIPLTISRALFFGVVISAAFAILAVCQRPKYIGRTVATLSAIVIVFACLSELTFFQTATEVFTTRFEGANKTEGGLEGVLLDRYLGGMVSAFTQSSQFPFLGYGLGLGTNAGSMLQKGEVMYLISEGEWGRLIGEMGFIMGIAVILIRLGLSAKLALASYLKLAKGDLLPWMLLSFALLIIPQGQWGQPTSLGFSTVIGGLLLASFRVPISARPAVKVTDDNAFTSLPSML